MSKNKHNHTATKKIKAWLFAIMLLLPFLFLLPTGLYYGLNQNAQLSERIEQGEPIYYQSNEVSQTTDLIPGNVYRINHTYQSANYNIYVEIEKYWIISTDALSNQSRTDQLYDIPYIKFGDNGYLYIYVNNEQDNNTIRLTNCIVDFVFKDYIATQFTSEIGICSNEYIKDYQQIETTNDISTSIINAWNSTWQNPLFSWTNYSPFYAPMQSFTNVFGINDMQIANVLTYLATITAIYIVFDIVIELFTYLTHLIPRSD